MNKLMTDKNPEVYSMKMLTPVQKVREVEISGRYIEDVYFF